MFDFKENPRGETKLKSGHNPSRTYENPSHRHVTAAQLAEDIRQFVLARDHVSFVELQRRYGDEARGHWSMSAPGYPGVILWGAMSRKLIKAIETLRNAGQIELRPASSALVYLLDGCIPDMPLAVGDMPQGGWAEPRWLPTLLCRPTNRRTEDSHERSSSDSL